MAEQVPAQCYNWASFSIQEKRGWVDGKPGARAVDPASTAMNSVSDTTTSANDTLFRRLDGLGVEWRGPASDAAQARLRAVGTGMDASVAVTSDGSRRLDDYGHSFQSMASQIVYDDPARAGWWESWSRTDGWQAALGVLDSRLSFNQANQQNSAQADHALTVHAANAADAASRFGTDAGPGTPWPGDAPPGSGHGGGSGGALSSNGVPPGGAMSSVSGGAGGVPGSGSGSGSPPGLATMPARVPPPTSQAAGPPPGGSPPGGPSPGGSSPSGSSTGGSSPGGPSPGAAGAPAPGGPASPTPGAPSPGVWTPPASPPVGQAGGPPSSRPQPGVPRADPGGLSGSERAARFTEGLRDRQMPVPGSFGAGAASGVPGGGHYGRGGAGGWGAPISGGTRAGGAGGWGGTGGGSGSSAWGGAGTGSGGRGLPGASSGPYSEGGGTGGRGTAARPGPVEGPGPAGGRVAERGAGGYGPMMGGGGAGSAGNQEHRNRYLLPSDEVFAVPLAATDPVLGPEDDDHR